MPIVTDPQKIQLILELMGIEDVKTAGKAFEDLKEKTHETVSPIDQAKAALAETSPVVDQLKTRIAELEAKLQELKGAFRSGLIESEYEFLEKAADFENGIKRHEKALGLLEGTGDGESGTGGFAGAAAGALKFERAALGLATGHGLRGASNALEGLVGMLGGPAGVGLAIGAFATAVDVLLPKLTSWIEKLDGTAAAAKRTAEQFKEAKEQMAKLGAQPTEEEQTGAHAVKELLGGRQGVLVAQGVEQALRQQGIGLMTPEERAISEAFMGPEATAERERSQQDRAVAIRRAAIMRDLEAGRVPAISEVSGMAGQFPGLFPAGTEQRFRRALPENIEAARRQARQAEEVSRQADEQAEQQEAAAKENEGIQQEFNKALQDRGKHQDKQLESTMRSDEAFEKKREAAQKHAEAKAEQARKHAEAQARQAERKEAREERENTPRARLHRQQVELENRAEYDVAQRFPQAMPEEIRRTAREALERLPSTGGNWVLAVQEAVLAGYQRAQEERLRDAKRLQIFTEAFVQ